MVKHNLPGMAGNPETLVRIGARLRQAREQAGLSQRELAASIGTQTARVASYESGAARLTARGLFEIAGALRKPVAWFFEGLPEATVGRSNAGAAALAKPSLTSETQALIEAFDGIGDPETRRDILRLLRAIAAEGRSRR